MKALGHYDTALQMFIEPAPRELDLHHLEFLRYLGEQGKLEHPLAGPIPEGWAEQQTPAHPAPSYSGRP